VEKAERYVGIHRYKELPYMVPGGCCKLMKCYMHVYVSESYQP